MQKLLLLRKCDSTTEALPAILETLANFWSEFSFQYSYRWQIGQLQLH